MDLRKIINRELERQGMTRSELAERAAMTPARVSDYLNQKRDVYAETVERILDVLGLTVTSKRRGK